MLFSYICSVHMTLFSLCVVHGQERVYVQVTEGQQRYVFPGSCEKVCCRCEKASSVSASGSGS
jgi:hypothetical protein